MQSGQQFSCEEVSGSMSTRTKDTAQVLEIRLATHDQVLLLTLIAVRLGICFQCLGHVHAGVLEAVVQHVPAGQHFHVSMASRWGECEKDLRPAAPPRRATPPRHPSSRLPDPRERVPTPQNTTKHKPAQSHGSNQQTNKPTKHKTPKHHIPALAPSHLVRCKRARTSERTRR